MSRRATDSALMVAALAGVREVIAASGHHPAQVTILDMIIGTLEPREPSKAVLRNRRWKAEQKRKKECAAGDALETVGDVSGDALGHVTGDVTKDASAAVSATSPVARVPDPALLSSDLSGTSEPSSAASPSTDRAGSEIRLPDAPPRARLLAIWERVALNGLPCGSPSVHGARLETLWPALTAREPADPCGLFERVCAAYVADRKAKGKTPDTRFFVDDFDNWAGRESTPPPEDHADKLRRLRLELSEARIAADLAGDMGDQATQERHAGRAKQLADKIEQLATRAA